MTARIYVCFTYDRIRFGDPGPSHIAGCICDFLRELRIKHAIDGWKPASVLAVSAGYDLIFDVLKGLGYGKPKAHAYGPCFCLGNPKGGEGLVALAMTLMM